MIDYQQIIENLDTDAIKHLLYELGATNYKETETCVIFPTICHHCTEDEASQKLYYYKNTHMFICYSECGAMSIFRLLKHYYEIRGIDYDWYSDIYEVVLHCSTYTADDFINIDKYESTRDKYNVVDRNVQLPIFSESVLDVFIKTYPQEWLDDKISTAAMDKFNILYSISQNKIIIPHYDVNYNLIGIRGRALNDWEIENIGKYMPVKIENTWYKHPLSMNLYGLAQNKENIKKNHICFIAEGEKSVLQAESFARDNCVVAACGSNLNKFQLNLLMKECHPSEIVLCFDSEELPYEDKYFYKLWDICAKYKNYCTFSFIYDRQHLLNLKQSPFDCGEQIFDELLKRRVFIK